MLKYLLTVFLIVSIAQCDGDYFLTPTFPSTAFYQQYYEVRFRVVGLDYPTFTFSNLPNFFSGSQSGVVSGTPNITGTFRFTVNYKSGSISGSEQTVISVTSSSIITPSASQTAQLNFIIDTASDSFVFKVGASISFSLSTQNGVVPITWSYKNLPRGLSGDNSGRVSGVISQEGTYSFSASAGDAKGKSSQSYFTLNVQPQNIAQNGAIIDVPDRSSVPVVYNATQVQGQQIAADTAVASAYKVVQSKKAVVLHAQEDQAKTQSSLDFAAAQQNGAEATVASAQATQVYASNNFNKAYAILQAATNTLSLYQTNLDNANRDLATSKANLATAQSQFDAANKALADATDRQTKTLNELTQSEANYNATVVALKDAQNAYKISWDNLQDAKTKLDQAKDDVAAAAIKVANAQNAVNLASTANDAAQTALNKADADLVLAQQILSDANNNVSAIREKWTAAKTDLGLSQFNLTQALNQLYVAQAAKAAADKATAIAYAQGVAAADVMAGASKYVFSGCYNQVYPSISGSVSVVNLIDAGALVSSGHVLTWGDCTNKVVTVNVGDKIYYEGSIVNGCISTTKVTKIA